LHSAAGKTQFLLTLLLSVQLDVQNGSPRTALYISTEAQLQTTRLNQILESHPKLADLPPDQKPTLARIQSTHIHDLEAQEHILQYQVPVAIERFNVGIIIIDSIAANYRAEFEKGGKPSHSLAKRSAQVARLGTHLRDLARSHNIAVVVANQVADRFESQSMLAHLSQQQTQTPRAASPSQKSTAAAASNITVPLMQHEALLSTSYPLALDHQQRFFTGWGDDPMPHSNATMKTPSLGLTWTNQLATRIALVRSPIYEDRAYQPGEDKSVAGWKRTMKIVFSAWSNEGETGYEIWQGGVRGLGDELTEAE
jgi:DNA repair protein RAD57